MLNFLCENVELRGASSISTKRGNSYIRLNVETANGEPYNFLCKDATVFTPDFKKGDNVSLVLEYNQTYNRLSVVQIKKVG